ncbi:UNVERIFIED_CONTAM: hypothetical protein PYX00_011737 [Menopon gallinae]|uniref:Ubiquitin activating enzyme 4 n=1 Tax=Menopon gallinae TaxID=328185 RepID=A0AAW2H8I1_9NEOP
MGRLYETALPSWEMQRYARQIVLPDVGVCGQGRLGDAKVLVVGLGGLGAPVLAYLCSAGVGTIGIVDHDIVELHNLQRQIIYSEESVGRPKTECALKFAKGLNNTLNIHAYSKRLGTENIASIAGMYSVVADCTDSIECRYLISDYCRASGKDMVLASVLRMSGQIFVLPAGAPCFRCLFPVRREAAENCDEVGVLGAMCGAVGSLQAVEVVKMILKRPEPSVITYDAISYRFRSIKLRCRSNSCSAHDRDCTPASLRVSVGERYMVAWSEYLSDPRRYYLVDVRKKSLFDICHIKGSVNIPIECLERTSISTDRSILLVCRRGGRPCCLQVRGGCGVFCVEACSTLLCRGFRRRACFDNPPMESDEYRILYEIVKKKGTDFQDIAKDPRLEKYKVEELEDAYVHIMDHIRFLCPESGGCEEIMQIKDVYRIGGDIFFDVLTENCNGKKVVKKEVFLDDYRSKFFTLVKDYKFFLMGKLNMIREIERSFRKSPRVAGLILGSNGSGSGIHVTNSFAVPFEEDEENGVWFFDTAFQLNMFDLFKKIHSNEKILGWYHSGANLHKNDRDITMSLASLVQNPLLLVVDIYAEKGGFPVKVFRAQDGELVHVNTCIEAEEAEEVGVEHLIRDIKHENYERNKVIKESLLSYEQSLGVIESYLENVLSGAVEGNPKILARLQDCLNSIPSLMSCNEENRVECYSANLVRSIVAMNDLDMNRKSSISD